jgi:hypothetical protein
MVETASETVDESTANVTALRADNKLLRQPVKPMTELTANH